MGHQIRIAGSDHTFLSDDDESVLEAAEKHGLRLAHDCRFGGCSTCRIKLLEGEVTYAEWPFGLTEAEAESGYALACQARAASNLKIQATLWSDHFQPPDLYPAIIVDLQEVCASVVRVRLQIAEPVTLLPGQYFNLCLDDGTQRSFSLANLDQSQWLECHIRRVPNGHFTQQLGRELGVGHALEVELPLGQFLFDHDSLRPAVMLATGTGIAPLRAMLQDLAARKSQQDIVLFWGNRAESDFYLHDELIAYANLHPWFTYFPVISKGGSPGYETGYVQQVMQDQMKHLNRFDAYLCGNPNMILDAKERLLAEGISTERIFSDSFLFQHQLETSSTP